MPIFLGGAVLAIAVSLGFVMFYMLPFSEGRNTTKWALGMMVAAAISFLAMYGVIIVGWILLGAAMLLLAFVFMKAPMPGKSEAEELPPVPSIAQPIRH